MKVLVTGATGFVGRHLVNRLKKKNVMLLKLIQLILVVCGH